MFFWTYVAHEFGLCSPVYGREDATNFFGSLPQHRPIAQLVLMGTHESPRRATQPAHVLGHPDLAELSSGSSDAPRALRGPPNIGEAGGIVRTNLAATLPEVSWIPNKTGPIHTAFASV